MRIVMATFGTAGDVMPFAEIGRVLVSRGHDVEVVTDRAHRALVESRGLCARTPLARYDPAILTSDPRYARPVTGPWRLWTEIFLPLVPEMFHAVGESLARPTDVVLVHPWCHGALYAAERAGVPVASVAMAPLTWWSADEPGFYSHHAIPAVLHGAMMRGPVRWMLDTFLGRGLERARGELGLSPRPHPFFAIARESTVAYGLWSPLLRGPAADDPPNATICGFRAEPPDARGLSATTEAFLARGPAPIVVGMGSLLPPMAAELYAMAREVALALDRSAILVGAPPELAGEEILVVPEEPYARLFERASVVVHHGGAGTSAEALRSGKPQVVVPFGNDQFDNAFRLERLGVARSVPKPRLATGRFRAAIEWALRPSSTDAAREVARRIVSEPDGAGVVADDLERRFAKT